MSIRKPLEKPKTVDIDALIERGSPVKGDTKSREGEYAYINLRVPVHMLKQIDARVSNRVGVKRTGWILEAIHRAIMEE